MYTEDYLNELKSATPARVQTPVKQSIAPSEPTKSVEKDVIVQDEDVIMLDESDDESDGYIPLDPEVAAEEKDLLESRIFNEFDLEGM